jgi:DNA-directed RNA polymerase specialized sigma24 family protein
MSNSTAVAVAGSEKSPTPALTEAQLSAFWAGIVANGDAARRMALGFVPPQEVDDVVSSASILFLESLQRPEKPARIPADENEFRARYLVIVRNHAIDCVRDADASDRPVHSHWGVEYEPHVGGRRTADRPLDHVFARNDRGEYDAPATPGMRDQDDVDKLGEILGRELEQLTRMQRTVITETFLEGRKRAEVAARHGISVKTYDNHLQAAFAILRDELWFAAHRAGRVDRSSWYDRIEQLSDRYDAAFSRRVIANEIKHGRLTPEQIAFLTRADKKSGAGAA